ncbi:hypothetical protein PTNB29_03147 [Pyrenophora teres f. teres]|nr:hypothetical protein PTNB29_03147 [Pyrenophora teres f. teres]
MPRPKKPGVEPKKRSRNGCWPCKARKVKCGEEKPQCTNCERQGEACDYSIRLNWGGRAKREMMGAGSGTPSAASGSPYQSMFSFEEEGPRLFPSTPEPLMGSRHARSHSNVSLPKSIQFIDPALMRSTPPSTINAGFMSENPYFQEGHGLRMSAPYAQAQFQSALDSHSPIAASTPGGLDSNFTSVNATMPPPQGSADFISVRQQNGFSSESPETRFADSQSPHAGSPTHYSPYPATLLTSASGSPDYSVLQAAPMSQDSELLPADLRRVSVKSLINDMSGPEPHQYSPEADHRRQYPIADSTWTTYGYDLGLPDLDTPRNDDNSAIALFSPPNNAMDLDDDTPYGTADAHAKDTAPRGGGYYANPVPIRIPKNLEPLPPLLMENRMNLLYFHHFINHIARMLVPHDCERNPFRQILPGMAVQDESIMNLILAFGASHRARMLHYPAPSNRIAVWVQDVFPKLRRSLNDNPHDIPDSTLAAIVMMASVEIICSGTFEVPVSWRSHLTMARQMIIQRGGPKSMTGMGRHDRVAYFVSRWFAYLDVIGSLSGNKNGTPLASFYWSSENTSTDEDFEIDCLMGFTTRCIGSLARISELAKRCEPQRIDEEGNVREGWVPGPEIVEEAVRIRRALEEGLLDRNIRKGCNHRSSTSSESEGVWDASEIYATNELFHWAGLIHLYRRILGKPAMDAEVQHAVREIIGLLYKVRRGSTAEACLIFPMFAAGCDAQDEGQREKILDRLKGVEGFGLNHVPKISNLMKSVWETGKPWESLVSDEFFG